MRTLDKVEEFRKEAARAIFTKEQALSVARQLIELEIARSDGSDKAALEKAKQRISISYFDATSTETDGILDAAGVARLTVNDIADAIDVIMFEVE